jgi:hypothetical protein
VRTHVRDGLSACGASIGKVFERFKFPLHWAGVLASVALCACACRCARGAPIEPVLVFSEVLLCWFRTPARLTGPLRDPLFKLVWFCWIIKGRPKFCSRTYIAKYPQVRWNIVDEMLGFVDFYYLQIISVQSIQCFRERVCYHSIWMYMIDCLDRMLVNVCLLGVFVNNFLGQVSENKSAVDSVWPPGNNNELELILDSLNTIVRAIQIIRDFFGPFVTIQSHVTFLFPKTTVFKTMCSN